MNAHEAPWILVVASSDEIAVRVLIRDHEEAFAFARWIRCSGWRVRMEPTRARNPYALGRTPEEEYLALGLTIAYDRWAAYSGHRLHANDRT